MTNWNIALSWLAGRRPRLATVGSSWRLPRFAGVALAAVVAAGSLAGAPAAHAYSAIVIDASTGSVLYRRHADKTRYPASLAKMMTLYLIFDALEAGEVAMDTRFSVSAHAESQRPSELGLKRGESISVEDSILALMTKSANDVASAVAEGLGGGSERRFARMMTDKARELGMRRTTFANASGWHDRNMVSTARDMAILSLRLINDHPRYYPLFSTTRFTWRGTAYGNHNKLLGRVAGVDGLKTGYTRPAGWNLAASARRDGRRIVAVVMGGDSRVWRDRRMKELLSQGFVLAARHDRDVPLPGHYPRPEQGVIALAALDEASTTSAVTTTVTTTVTDAAADDSLAALVAALVREDSGAGNAGDTGASGAQGSAGEPPWAVQVGAFSQADSAQRALEDAHAHLAGLVGQRARRAVIAVESAGQTLFRARLVNLTEDQARESCQALYRRDMDCAVVRYAAGG